MSDVATRQYGASILSLMAANGFIKGILKRNGLKKAYKLAQSLDLKIQMLPLRNKLFRTKEVTQDWDPDMIISFEDRWGDPVQHALLELRTRGRIKNAVAAWLLFMGKKQNDDIIFEFRDHFKCLEVDIERLPLFIYADPKKNEELAKRLLREPDINTNPDWEYWSTSGGRFVLDTHHLREFDSTYLQRMRWINSMVAEDRIGLVQIQFRDVDELKEYLNGTGETHEMVMCVANTTIPVVFELDDVLSSAENLGALKKKTQQFIG